MKIIETLERIEEVDVENFDVAKDEVKNQWKKAEIVLSAANFVAVEFMVLQDE